MKYEIFSSKYVGIEPELVNKKFVKLDMKMQEGYGYELGGYVIGYKTTIIHSERFFWILIRHLNKRLGCKGLTCSNSY
jgi:hypothetical protein